MNTSPPHDRHFMQIALRLGAENLVRTVPNPSVGCVIVRNDEIIGQGATGIPGSGHAEIAALADCERRGETPAGATVYVTLEPCTFHGRTGPCATQLIKAGVARVVFAARDPNPQMANTAAQVLGEKGIDVVAGVMAPEAEKLHADFLFRQRFGRPLILAKMAVTLDGAAAKRDGSSKWITGFEARAQVHQIRADADAVLTSARTILIDNARYTVRHVQSRHTPDLVILGKAASLLSARPDLDRAGSVFLNTGPSVTTVTHAKVINVIANAQGHASTQDVVRALAKLPYNRILLEAGPKMLQIFDRDGFVDELTVFMSSKIFGSSGLPAFGEMLGEELAMEPRYAFRGVSMVGLDVCLELERCV